ncbi:XRE family transcriptional regulator [Lysobacter changpingensis]|uniref:XRE family transcriptional regulator n=1 Tax=Lysobacter changpingensis TaxID=2792784 RepID=UPI001A90A295|nr:XRE family transcriptional regulator [Lysobacter changpingensis]
MSEIGDVWDALYSGPTSVDLRARSDLMILIQERLTSRAISVEQAARLVKVDPAAVSDLLSGKIDLFTAEELRSILGKLLDDQ